MSYTEVFNPPKEIMEKYRPILENITVAENIITLNIYNICSNPSTPVGTELYIKTYLNCPTTPENVELVLRTYLNMLEGKIQKRLYEVLFDEYEERGTLTFSGWTLLQPNNFSEISESIIKKLAILSIIVPTPSFFEERENFDTFINEIDMLIDDYIDACYDNERKKLLKELEPYKKIVEE